MSGIAMKPVVRMGSRSHSALNPRTTAIPITSGIILSCGAVSVACPNLLAGTSAYSGSAIGQFTRIAATQGRRLEWRVAVPRKSHKDI